MLSRPESEKLRDELLTELARLDSSEKAAVWARRILPAKNTLTATDAQFLEQAFQSRMATINNHRGNNLSSNPTAELNDASFTTNNAKSLRSGTSPAQAKSDTGRVDKSGLAVPEPRRLRDKAHVKFVSKQPCLICGRIPSDPHHLRFAQQRALGSKVSDEFTVPLCRVHHREVHRCVDEVGWWQTFGIDPISVASTLWAQMHPHGTGPQETKVDEVGRSIEPNQLLAPSARKREAKYKTKPSMAAGSQ
jgi:hypothetical protein